MIYYNFLKYYGHSVTKEYYINDYGNQINIFLKSIYFRAIEILKINFQMTRTYPGEYIIDIANEILRTIDVGKYDSFKDVKSTLAPLAIKLSMAIIKNDLKIMGIKHDISFRKLLKKISYPNRLKN